MTDLLDEVMGWVRAGKVPPPADLESLAKRHDARLLAEAFTGEDGRKRLMIFARMTVLRPPVDPTLNAVDGVAYAHLRQGQNSMFAAVVQYLDIHQAALKDQADDRRDRAADHPYARTGPVALGVTDAGSDDVHDERFTDGGFDPGGLVAGQ